MLTHNSVTPFLLPTAFSFRPGCFAVLFLLNVPKPSYVAASSFFVITYKASKTYHPQSSSASFTSISINQVGHSFTVSCAVTRSTSIGNPDFRIISNVVVDAPMKSITAGAGRKQKATTSRNKACDDMENKQGLSDSPVLQELFQLFESKNYKEPYDSSEALKEAVLWLVGSLIKCTGLNICQLLSRDDDTFRLLS